MNALKTLSPILLATMLSTSPVQAFANIPKQNIHNILIQSKPKHMILETRSESDLQLVEKWNAEILSVSNNPEITIRDMMWVIYKLRLMLPEFSLNVRYEAQKQYHNLQKDFETWWRRFLESIIQELKNHPETYTKQILEQSGIIPTIQDLEDFMNPEIYEPPYQEIKRLYLSLPNE